MLIINNCAFRADMPRCSKEEYPEAFHEEMIMYARECVEHIVSVPLSVRLAGGPDTDDICQIANWACPFVAAHYGIDAGYLYSRWLKHAGPPLAQIMLNPALRDAFFPKEQL